MKARLGCKVLKLSYCDLPTTLFVCLFVWLFVVCFCDLY